ncbi:ferric enterobactin transporter permease FepG [Corynebacterium yudongzhengii]|uniref:Iron ABC transporter permease n=1 Tax=Corynebacterium yudongzhengii TaxID=2080740 RepID=A0A2U1T9V5_9CORY|nr:iron ABC transporter permease [Corynebacterium yudongzhengii]AWB81248.1 ferric enterobactin transporter permease FepG [Corynebacterium yudongzhengii]PWC02787.1 iron ABC transporter permease [Corynebacterium yudongzhengii]
MSQRQSQSPHAPVLRALRVGPASMPINPRLLLCVALAGAVLALGVCYSVTQGEFQLSMGEVLAVFAGGGSAIERAVVFDMRLGRAVVACLVGAALGFSGALTQSVARNPLASPDILGITNGASLAAVATIIFAGAGAGGVVEAGATTVMATVGIPGAAIIGAGLAAVVIWLLAGSARGSVLKVVLIGVGMSIFLSSMTTWLLAYAQLDRAASARMWLTGSLNGRDWNHAGAPFVVVLVAVLVGGWLAFQLAALVLGPATAHVLGHRVGVAQAVQLVVAVILAAVAVAAAGPIGFIAFVSPHVARGLARTPTPPLMFSALMGAVLLLGADLLARVVLPWELPVGVVTAFIGAPFLLYIIVRVRREETV